MEKFSAIFKQREALTTKPIIWTFILAASILLISFGTIFHKYDYPPQLFWDEPYHIAAAQKYQNKIFFMEPHPPFGKLLIALGEEILNANEKDSQFLDTDYQYISDPNLSLKGYRFLPVLLATLCPVLVFLLLKNLVPLPIASLFAFFLATENAFISHSRSAMLEGSQMFFILLFFILASIFIVRELASKKIFLILAACLGVALGIVLCIKINAIILVVPCLALILLAWHRGRAALFTLALTSGFLFSFCFIWALHISLTKEVREKLPEQGFYKASAEYKIDLISKGEESASFFLKLKDNFEFFRNYTKGVPDLNFCKPGENGSPWYWWLFGGRSVRYRYDGLEGGEAKYNFLAVNPVSWSFSFAGVILGISLTISSFLCKLPIGWMNLQIIRTLSLSWLAYIFMATIAGRVLYLYHYFIPLIFGWVLLAILSTELNRFYGSLLKRFNILILLSIVFLQVGSFYFFAPLTYSWPLTNEQLSKRNFLEIWDIACAGCETTNPVAQIIVDPKKTISPPIYISGLQAVESYQEWGSAQMDKSVIYNEMIVNGQSYKGIGVHSKSQLTFINNNYKKFTGKVGLADYLKDEDRASVSFVISLDGRTAWRSSVVRAGDPLQSFDLIIEGAKYILLEVLDAGDGITQDHGLWLEPRFE